MVPHTKDRKRRQSSSSPRPLNFHDLYEAMEMARAPGVPQQVLDGLKGYLETGTEVIPTPEKYVKRNVNATTVYM